MYVGVDLCNMMRGGKYGEFVPKEYKKVDFGEKIKLSAKKYQPR